MRWWTSGGAIGVVFFFLYSLSLVFFGAHPERFNHRIGRGYYAPDCWDWGVLIFPWILQESSVEATSLRYLRGSSFPLHLMQAEEEMRCFGGVGVFRNCNIRLKTTGRRNKCIIQQRAIFIDHSVGCLLADAATLKRRDNTGPLDHDSMYFLFYWKQKFLSPYILLLPERVPDPLDVALVPVHIFLFNV